MFLVADGSHYDELFSTLAEAQDCLAGRYSYFTEGMPDVWYTPEVSYKKIARDKFFSFNPRVEAWGEADLTRTYYATISRVAKDYQLAHDYNV